MVTITNIRNAKSSDYDEVWAIVRSIKDPGKMRHVTELSPSWDLFRSYLDLRDTGLWNLDTFQDVYVPIFLKEMQSEAACRKLGELVRLDGQGKHICLVCFCPDEVTCHRSIIAGILQYRGIQVDGVKDDYSHYGRLYFKEETL